ncbi:DUF418 domain-containing protein [Marinimicrobium sp. ABcell2]|uniref:DUF418 domain-containing protein n=1 Tax=Marinimicrobium sp. ABcell2 TaxID=3069751 RepID=UPI0027B4BA16|nr:DUF418 domain-containing protein [Marinimicrobium sp. ABcell2]MDQ2077013.1 DUF418 domain-containing protein [Marinimicrobium sp. ABcell2]
MTNSGRIESLDALRGFALLGILVVNIQMFSGWGFLGTEGRASLSWSDFDSEIHRFLTIVAHDKFYSLFSLLFGYSFVMLAGKKGGRYHLRRMVGLMVIGLAHAVFLWPWDILFLYAFLGLFLTPFLNAKVGTLWVAVALLLLITAVGRWLILTFEPAGGWSTVYVEQLQAGVPDMARGTYGEVVGTNALLSLGIALDRIEDLQPLRVLTMFLIGAVGARLHLAEADNAYRKPLLLVALAGLPVALVIASLERMLIFGDGIYSWLFVTLETIAAPLTAVGYAALLTLWWNNNGPVAAGVRSTFAPAGRMALTNYLAQSAFCVPVFYGFGLGLFAEFSLAKLLLWCLGIFVMQLIASRLWLSCFRQGPMEWLWRWQIQGSRPPFVK